ncbi:MAG: hypothetical protein JW724_02985 [Candidatus Altiarchaeota archaeon]|nr:hypothetical protein [Candidatus Altiarchaeota archaeon]
MNHNRRGQVAAFDIILLFLSITLFTLSIWAFSLNTQAPAAQAQRSREDYTKSLLLTTLYTTPVTDDPRYATKSISDLMGVYLALFKSEDELGYIDQFGDRVGLTHNAEDLEKAKSENDELKAVLIKELKEAKINEYLKEKVVGSEAEWFIYCRYYERFGERVERAFCFHGTSSSDEIDECPTEKTEALVSTTASGEVVFPNSVLKKANVFLTIKWA